MNFEPTIINLLTAAVIGFCAALQVTYYLTLKRRIYFWVNVAAVSTLTFIYPYLNGRPVQIAYALVSIAAGCLLCSLTYKEKRYHKLYSALIQAIISIAAVYISRRLTPHLEMPPDLTDLATLGFITFFNVLWCAIMYVARLKVFTVLPEPEETYARTFAGSFVVLALLLICVFGGDSFLLRHYPPELIFIGLVGVIIILSVLCILSQCVMATSKMIEEERLIIVASQNQIMKQYVDDLMMYNKTMRIIEHDQRHHLATLHTLLNMNHPEEALNLLAKLTERNSLFISKDFCDNSVINAILIDARNRCESSGVAFQVAVNLTERVVICDIDLISLLKNALDNAIEGSLKLADRSRASISLTIQTVGGHLALKCVNSVDAAPRIRNNRINTTKGGDGLRHGIGLESMHIVADKYEGLLKLDSDGRTFTLAVLLQNEPPVSK